MPLGTVAPRGRGRLVVVLEIAGTDPGFAQPFQLFPTTTPAGSRSVPQLGELPVGRFHWLLYVHRD